MHTWALFSCSSLITLTAYNFSQLPKSQEAGPEPEPDANDELTEASKFSLETVSSMFPESKPTVELPSLAPQLQLSKLDELSGYNPAIYDPDQHPVREINLAGALSTSDFHFSLPKPSVNYRANRVLPLSAAIREPLTLRPAPRPVVQPQLEPSAAAPTFAQSRQPSPALAQVPTTSSDVRGEPAQTSAANNSAAAPAIAAPAVTASPAESPELFDSLPVASATRPLQPQSTIAGRTENSAIAAARPADAEMLMADPFDFALTEVMGTAPDSALSMELAVTRQDLIQRYCDRPQSDRKESTSLAVCQDGTNELAASIPEAVTAGTPIPGSVESPTRSNPAIGVE